jgi:predicted O-methyltransferase YrrM
MRFFHKHLRRLLLFFLKRHPNLALDVLRHHPNLALDALRQQNSLSFANCPDRQQRNFEDLDWLLASNLTNRGLLRLAFDEAAFLFRLVRSQPAAQILEIGRYYGGSAFLLAVASDHNSMVTSIDIAPQNDELLQIALRKSGLADKVQLLVGDSSGGEARVDFYNLIFVDGDHSYEGVLKDYEHWRKAVKPGGCLAFHNAADGRPHTLTLPGPFRLAQEIAARDGEYYRREPDVGSLALFIRTRTPFLNAKKSDLMSHRFQT